MTQNGENWAKDDKIIDAKAAFDFFVPLTTTYFVKDTGHVLNV